MDVAASKHESITLEILRRIVWDKLPDKSYFGSENDLSKTYGTTRTTIRKSTAYLINQNVLYKESTKGLFVHSLARSELVYNELMQKRSRAYTVLNSRRRSVEKINFFSLLLVNPNGTPHGFYENELMRVISQINANKQYEISCIPIWEAEDLLRPEFLALIRRDGLIWDSPMQVHLPILQKLRAERVPLVLFNTTEKFDTDFVCSRSDEFAAANELAKYLLRQGKTRILSTVLDYSPVIQARQQGVIAAYEELGIKQEGNLFFEHEPEFARLTVNASAILQQIKPQAVISFYHRECQRLVALTRELKLEVPRDLVIAAFDDNIGYDFLPIPILGVRQPVEAMTRQAVETLSAIKQNIYDGRKLPVLQSTLIFR